MNIIVENSKWIESDAATLFDNEVIKFVKDIDISSLMSELKIYPSASKARQAGRVGPIPKGWTVFKASKKVTCWIWEPYRVTFRN